MAQRHLKIDELGIPILVLLCGPNLVGGSGYSGFNVNGAPNPSTRSNADPREMDARWRCFMGQGLLGQVNKVDGG